MKSTTATTMKSTHTLTVAGEPIAVVAIAYRARPNVDEQGPICSPRLATENETRTGIAADGYEIDVVLALPEIATRALAVMAARGYDGRGLAYRGEVFDAQYEIWRGRLISPRSGLPMDAQWALTSTR